MARKLCSDEALIVVYVVYNVIINVDLLVSTLPSWFAGHLSEGELKLCLATYY